MSRLVCLLFGLGLAFATPAHAQECTGVACDDSSSDPADPDADCPEGYDLCGVCNGDSACVDEPDYGDVCVEAIDACGVCGGDGESCLDCAGVPNGTAVEDACGQCIEPASPELEDSSESGSNYEPPADSGSDYEPEPEECGSTLPTTATVTATAVLSCHASVQPGSGRARRWMVCAGSLPWDAALDNPSWFIKGGAARLAPSADGEGEAVEVLVDFTKTNGADGPKRVAPGKPGALVLESLPMANGFPGNQGLRGTVEIDDEAGEIRFEGLLSKH